MILDEEWKRQWSMDENPSFSHLLPSLLSLLSSPLSLSFPEYEQLRMAPKGRVKTDRIRMDITDIIFIFIFLVGFGFEYG